MSTTPKSLCYTYLMKRWLSLSQLARTSRSKESGAGYTIIEALIVLAVTTVMFMSVSLAFRGRQARVEFTQAVRNYEAKIQSIISEVQNGYFENRFECNTTLTGSPTQGILPVGRVGGNEDCIFLGKIIASGQISSTIMTVAGRRTVTVSGTERDVESLTEAMPEALPETPPAGFTNSFEHSYQLKVRKVVRISDNTSVAAFGFFNRLTAAGGNKLIELYGIPTITVGTPPVTVADHVDNYTPLELTPITSGILICLEGQNGQLAEVKVGEANGQTTISSVLDTENTGACFV